MRIYPAIDIKEGKCVRLKQGNFENTTVYSNNPIEMAKKWEQFGAQYLHIVDLDGARSGKSINREIIQKIVHELSIPIQLGGGIRTLQDVERALNDGVQRVILGTSAVKNPELVKEAVKQYGERIVVGIDAKDGMVAIEGWEQISACSAIDFAKQMEQIGVQTIVYTDIAKDGMLEGPNIEAMKEMTQSVSIDVIASGGVSSKYDIIQLKETEVEGVIIGKALYTGNIDLRDVLEITKGC